MSTLGELLARFLEYLFIWMPRPVYCPPGIEAHVLWRRYKDPVVKRGLWVTVPLFDYFEQIDTRLQASRFEPNTLWTKDGKEAAVGMLLIWRISDPLVAAEALDELGSFVIRSGESVLPELVGKFDLDDMKRKAAGGEGREWGFDQHLRTKLNSLFEKYGIEVTLALLNFTSDRTRTFKLIGSNNELEANLG